jgi:peroxiredoxin
MAKSQASVWVVTNWKPKWPSYSNNPIALIEMKSILLTSLIVTSLSCLAVGAESENPTSSTLPKMDSVVGIRKHFAAKKAKALEDYLTANPNADDALMVMRQLAWCYEEISDTRRQLATLEKQYAAMPKGAEGNPSIAFENIFGRFCIHRGNNPVAVLDKAFAVIEQGKRDFPQFDQTEQGPMLDDLVAKLKLHTIGSPVDIAFTALDGRKVDITAMKGKVVLVIYVDSAPDPDDAAMIKQVKATYEKLQDKGFEVIGLSLEKDRTALEIFVKKENLPWPQAYDSQGWDFALAVNLIENTLPFNFLVGKDGRMAARHVGGNELEARVLELLN